MFTTTSVRGRSVRNPVTRMGCALASQNNRIKKIIEMDDGGRRTHNAKAHAAVGQRFRLGGRLGGRLDTLAGRRNRVRRTLIKVGFMRVLVQNRTNWDK